MSKKLDRKQLNKAHKKWLKRVSNTTSMNPKQRNAEILAAGCILAFDVASVLDGVKVYK